MFDMFRVYGVRNVDKLGKYESVFLTTTLNGIRDVK